VLNELQIFSDFAVSVILWANACARGSVHYGKKKKKTVFIESLSSCRNLT